MANGENARFKQFHHLKQYFQKSTTAEASDSVCMWERITYSKYAYRECFKLSQNNGCTLHLCVCAIDFKVEKEKQQQQKHENIQNILLPLYASTNYHVL